MISLPLLIAAPLGLLCALIIYMDLRFMRIPDAITAALVVLFCVWIIATYPAVPILMHLAVAGVVFVICFVLFAFRIMGGGDTKVIPALALFVPLGALSGVLLLFAACLMVSIVLVVILRKTVKGGAHSWKVVTSPKLPMGVAIGSTGLISLLVSQI